MKEIGILGVRRLLHQFDERLANDCFVITVILDFVDFVFQVVHVILLPVTAQLVDGLGLLLGRLAVVKIASVTHVYNSRGDENFINLIAI